MPAPAQGLLLAQPAYTLTVGAGFGGLLLARVVLGALLKRRRYNPMSSLNVRSQP